MRIKAAAVAMALLTLAACGQPAPKPADAPPAEAGALPPPPAKLWFFCDAIDAPVVITATVPDESGAVTLTEFDKAKGAKPRIRTLTKGAEDAAAGSVTTLLMESGREALAVRALNPGALEDPEAAWTTPVVGVTMSGKPLTCRWRARTRLAALAGDRTLLALRDAEDRLILQTFAFADARNAAPALIGGAERSTRPSSELIGIEETGRLSVTMSFDAPNGERFILFAPDGELGAFAKWKGGEKIASDAIAARLFGEDPNLAKAPVR